MLPVKKEYGRGLRLWEPFGEFRTMQDEVDRLFGSLWRRNERPEVEGAWLPAIDLHEDEEQLVIKAELPGVKKEDVTISITDDLLTIKGELRHEEETKGEQFYRLEGSYGTFERAVRLPRPVKAEAIKADYRDGVLKITLPKADEAKTRQIKIDVK